jgi:predicted aminopeptidase
MLLRYRRQLDDLYRSNASAEDKRAGKRQLFAALKSEYAALRAGWGGYAGYDRYFAQDLTNAHLAAVGAYNDWVPAFDGLLAQSGGDFPRFYAEVARLAALPRGQRESELRGVRVSR